MGNELFKLIKQVLLLKQIEYTNDFLLKSIERHESREPLNVLKETLNSYYIDSMLVHLSASELRQINLLIVAQMANQELVILTGLKNEKITYINCKGKKFTKPIEDFEKLWTGISLVIGEDDGFEPGFQDNKKLAQKSTLQKAFKVSCIVGLIILFMVLLADISSFQFFTLTIAKLLGLVFGFLLTLEYYGKSISIFRLNNDVSRTSCRAVLHSNASSIFGIRFTDLGLMYFGFTSLLMLTAIFSNTHYYIQVVKIINFIVLPYTLFSIVYQIKIIKKWCPWCLCVSGILWGEFILLYNQKILSLEMQRKEAVVTVFFFLLIICFLMMLKPLFNSLTSLQIAESRLSRFVENDELLRIIIENGVEVTEVPNIDLELMNENSQNKLVMIFGSHSHLCTKAFFQLKELMPYFNQYISLRVIPMIVSELDFISIGVTKKIIDFYEHSTAREERVLLLNDFFSIKRKDEISISKWIYQNKARKVDDTVYHQLKEWLLENKISYTPCFILNNRIVPDGIRLEEITQYLRKKLMETE